MRHWIVSLIWITDGVYRRPFPSLSALEATLSIQPADNIQTLLPSQTSAAYEMTESSLSRAEIATVAQI